MEILYTAQATTSGGRNGKVHSSDNVLNLELRMPKGLGGAGGDYTNPEQLFAAGYSACFDSALNLVARMQKTPLQNTEVTAHVSIGKNEAGKLGLAVKLEVKIPNVEKEAAQKLLEDAHQVCPYSNATRNNIEVTLVLVD
jgi:osmotically inducible protein OsmC